MLLIALTIACAFRSFGSTTFYFWRKMHDFWENRNRTHQKNVSQTSDHPNGTSLQLSATLLVLSTL